MTSSDYKCPNCKRMKHMQGMRPVVMRKCRCSAEPVGYVRIQWSKFDWRMTCQALADLHNMPYYAVSAKRRALGRPKGNKGRKLRTDYTRRIEAEEVDLTISDSENARRFRAAGRPVSREWIRRLRLERQNNG